MPAIRRSAPLAGRPPGQRHTESFTTFLMQGAGRRMRGNLLHVSFNRIRLKDKNMQQIKVLQRPLRV
ncbi:hypothetical protein GHK61_22160 [Sinorhizobium meliloti]|uniref:Uncharacterized protein n=1 Tax=Rhizobium meliloti TaxID=382 RepID=A0AAW9TP44_RHIML|nr:hypothetical protein [Sinorhizobium meliloti]MQX59059.1 hypothetical protein [Sinorhizobium meliloti]